ncbi:HK97 gp10 family phage protein [Croceicoccus sp. BE223]|uniref:HK97 gp10 family phage protein n=1 Tax=Croceicoccus sp. BE223 TaxID=2817716 RepID=UPI0028648F40|nr:HK97 gp10 family phage protein [Croceicoccus sp. BE223]MDR7101521.1 hypothetical protein [Croceicoccus sp. BE223]
MPTVKGRAEVRAFMAAIPEALETKILRGAARAAAQVVADEAKDRVVSSEVRGAIKVSTKQEVAGQVIARIQTKGPGAYIAPWLEYGTSQHFITVDDSQRNGLSVGSINRKAKEGVLVINGTPVGKTVLHPGARPHPFMRVSLDLKAGEAIAAAQEYINARLAREGLGGAEVSEGDE